MDAIVALSWRAYPAGLLIAGGMFLVVHALRRAAARARPLRDPQRALVVVRGIRRAIVGLAVAAVGAAWWSQSGALFGVALVFLGEEMLEAAVLIAALRDGVRRVTRAGERSDAPLRRGADGVAGYRQRGYRTAASQRAMVASRSGGGGIA